MEDFAVGRLGERRGEGQGPAGGGDEMSSSSCAASSTIKCAAAPKPDYEVRTPNERERNERRGGGGDGGHNLLMRHMVRVCVYGLGTYFYGLCISSGYGCIHG